jgi:hypothetical protein
MPYRFRAEEREDYRDYGSRTKIKPPIFDGKGRWTDFIVQFEIVADVNGWYGQFRAVELASCLRDAAVSVLSLMKHDERLRYSTLVQTLRERFEPTNNAQMYQAALKRATTSTRGDVNLFGCRDKKIVAPSIPGRRGQYL